MSSHCPNNLAWTTAASVGAATTRRRTRARAPTLSTVTSAERAHIRGLAATHAMAIGKLGLALRIGASRQVGC